MTALLLACALAAQGAPGLHQRGEEPAPSGLEAVDAAGHTDLPSDAEGRYPFPANRGRITIFFEGGTLRGYMSELDESAPITLPFATTRADGQYLSWTTRTVHGRMYSFHGRLVRGAAADPSVPGYYVLLGTLMRSPGRSASLRSLREPGTP